MSQVLTHTNITSPALTATLISVLKSTLPLAVRIITKTAMCAATLCSFSFTLMRMVKSPAST